MRDQNFRARGRGRAGRQIGGFARGCAAALAAFLVQTVIIQTAIVQTAMAQDDDNIPREEIVVTGTHIRGTDAIGSTAFTIDQQEIVDSGKVSIGDYLREISQNLAGGVAISDETQSGQDAGPNGANLGAGQGVNLRGLGALSTLVLIDGRRVPASGQFGDFVDVSNIPISAVERVEVLLDGASAVYGSDAVAGVVNFVLKSRVDGPLTTLRYGTTTEGGGEEVMASQLFGSDWGSGGFVLGAEYYSRGNVLATDRDPYDNGSDFSALGGINWRNISAHYAPVANILLGNSGGAVSSPVGATVPMGSNTSLSQADLLPAPNGIGNTTNVYDGLDLLGEVERVSVFASGDHDLSSTVSISGNIRYSNKKSDYNLGYYPLFINSVPTTSPFYIDDIDPSLTNSDGSIPFAVVIDERMSRRNADVDSLGASIGLTWDMFSDWQGSADLSYGKEDQQRVETQPGDIPLGGAINPVTCALQGPATTNPDCAAAGLTPYNPFSTDPLSEQQLDELFGSEDLTFESELTQATLKADGSLFEMDGRPVKLAAGVDFYREKIEGFLVWDTGSLIPRSGPYTPTERDVRAAFAEFAVPVTETFDLSLAARYTEYSGTGDYDSTDPRIAAQWDVTEDFRIRGSWGTSFHAPPMRFENDDPQPLPGGNAAFTLPASYQGPCDSDIVEFNGLIGTPGTPGQSCSFTVIINSGGAGPGMLEPEEATTWTLGFDFEPSAIEGLSMSLSYYNIEIDERIQRIQSGTLPAIVGELFATGTTPFIAALNVRPTEEEARALQESAKYLGTFGPPLFNMPADVQMIVNATQVNIARLETTGFDFSASYDFEVNGSDAGVFAEGTYITSYDTEAAPGAGVVDQLGKYSSFGAPVELRSRLGGYFIHGAFDGMLTVVYTDDYECATGSCFVPAGGGGIAPNTSPVPIDSWTTVDLKLGWQVASETALSLTVNNLFDEEPPFLDGGSGAADNIPTAYDPANATIIGRTVALTLTRHW